MQKLNSEQIDQARAAYARAKAYPLDDPSASLDFTARLAREQRGWTRGDAAAAVEEYRRFMVLATLGATEVTPSEEVDQVWHLHLIYSRSYAAFCKTLCGRMIHHGPTKGGKSEQDRFLDQYEFTLQCYREVFGAPAPETLWPPPHVRFDRSQMGHWVREAEFFVIPRRMVRNLVRACAGTSVILTFLLILKSLVLSSAMAQAAEQNRLLEQISNSDLVLLVLAIFFAVVLLVSLVRAVLGKHKKDNGDGGCSGGSWFGCAGCGCGGCGGCGS